MFERDSAIAHAGHRLAALDIPKGRLLVGRLDRTDGSCWYVGRLAVADEHGDPLVIDWRAPAAEPFYRAYPMTPWASCGAATSVGGRTSWSASTTKCSTSPMRARPGSTSWARVR